jgi:regulator of RNase E activity RraA
MEVRPGELLHADANGVCAIPESIASEVAHAAAEFMACESGCIDFARSGKADVKGYSAARQEMLRSIEELGRRLRQPRK